MKLFAAFLTCAAVAACGGDRVSGPLIVDRAVGQYVLQTVGGKPLPAVISQASDATRSVTSGTMALNAFGTVTLSFDIQTVPSSGPATSRTIQGDAKWQRSASGLSFQNLTFNGGPTFATNATESSTGITLSGQGFTENGGDFFYQKSN